MKSILTALLCLIIVGESLAQDSTEIISNARNYIRQNNYSSAALILQQAISEDSTVISYKKELTWCYYYQDSFQLALNTMLPIIAKGEADEQCYQIAGYVYKGMEKFKECEALYENGLDKFPNSGPLYNDMGELLWLQKNVKAISYWENGIRLDPSFPANYYNAAVFYKIGNNVLWSILYGEIYVNMAPAGDKSSEIKRLLLEGYKKMFSTLKSAVPADFNTPFAKKYLTHLFKQEELAGKSLNTDIVIMIRTRFILDWFNDKNDVLPFKLFDLHQNLLREGLFVAYNQWLFGAVENPARYQRWTESHTKEYNSFIQYHQTNLFKMPPGQYYRVIAR